ncbi:MAG TPA: N-acetyltransferase, partial [Nitratifractor sp.]|nr:N-acetyltransferase [Nitratifractor sp.]
AIDLFDLDPHRRRDGIGILIADATGRMKGYAREAIETMKNYCFQVLYLHQLYCNIAADNSESIKLFRTAGFIPVGEKKDWLFNGENFESEWLFQFIHPGGFCREQQYVCRHDLSG